MPEIALDIQDLRFRYRRGRRGEPWVVEIPRLTLARGEQMLLTGGSGRGKSTLLYLAAGLLEPRAGDVFIGGQAIHALRGADRDRFRGEHIGMIFQTFNLLHGFSALENVMAALMFSSIPRGEHRRRAKALLGELGIEHPRRRPDHMSIGQQQRVAVARAVACDPNIVLADEPTASLDPENAAKAMDLIQRTCEHHGAALLVTSHDPAMEERFQRRASLDQMAAGVGVEAAPAVLIPLTAPVPAAEPAPESEPVPEVEHVHEPEPAREPEPASPSPLRRDAEADVAASPPETDEALPDEPPSPRPEGE